MIMNKWIISAVLLVLAPTYTLSSEKIVVPKIENGAKIFARSCTLCHGDLGLGDGPLPRIMGEYPNTNLSINRIGKDDKMLRRSIIYGRERGGMDNRMPPYGDELTWLEIESLIKFLDLFYEDRDSAIELLKKSRTSQPPSVQLGRAIYHGRCILCHGVNGDGKGKLSRIIKNPPPFDLTKSRAKNSYLKELITRGGTKMGRSEKMPTFGEELSDSDIESVISFIKLFRK